MCGHQNVRASAGENTEQNTKDTHQSKDKLKFLTPLGIEPGPPGWKAGTLQPLHGNGFQFIYFMILDRSKFTEKVKKEK